MADMNKNDDRTQAPKSRPRPEVKRPTVPPPGGLPLPPSRQQTVQQPTGLPLPPSRQQTVQQPIALPLPPSRQQSVPSSSSILPESGTTASNIEAPLSRPPENTPLSGTIPIDMFGLPDFRFSMPSTSTTGFGFSSSSRIQSPKHLPGITNIKIPNIFGGLSSRSGIAGPSLPSAIQLPRAPNTMSSRDQTTSDLPGMSASSSSADKPTRAKRPTDLPLSNVIDTNPSSGQVTDDTTGTSSANLPSSRTSKESQKSSHIRRKSDRKNESYIPNVPTSHMPVPSGVESNPGSSNLPEASGMDLPSTSASIHLPGSSSNVTSSDPQNLQRKRDVKRSSDPTPGDLPGPSGIRREGESMPSIGQHPGGARPKTKKSLMGKFKRFVKKRLSVKKKTGGPEDKEESTGLVFERDDEPKCRCKTRPKEPKKKYRPFPDDDYNHLLDRDPVIPNKEMEDKCYVCENSNISSPTTSMISDTNTSNFESQAPEQRSRSNPTPSTTERTCTGNSASDTLEQASRNPIAGSSESASASNPIAGSSESASASNPIAGSSESASASNPIAGSSESASVNIPQQESQKRL